MEELCISVTYGVSNSMGCCYFISDSLSFIVFLFLLIHSWNLRDCVKFPYLLYYHACAHLLGELYYLVLYAFHEAITLPPSQENDSWCVEFLMYRSMAWDVLILCVPTVSALIPSFSLPIAFTEILSDLISSADVTSFHSPCTYTVFI